MVRAFSAFLDFCYLVRRDTIDEDTIVQIEDALERFHLNREIFELTGVRESISLPRQHAMKHYIRMIRQFGSPNGLCSSMMEAKHIVAVKRPYRRSNKNNALGQIIKTNERLDKLAAYRVELESLGMLDGPCPRLPDFILRAQDPDRALDESDSDSDREHGEEADALQQGMCTLASVGDTYARAVHILTLPSFFRSRQPERTSIARARPR